MAKKIHIAIVDDHQMFADGLAQLIGNISEAYDCVPINSPLSAVQMIESGRRFDLVISDLIMDSINGIAFVKALRSRGARMPVLIVSGINTAPPVEEALRLGAQGFLPKSSSTETLREALETILAGEIFLPPKLWSAYEGNSRSPVNKRSVNGATSVELSQRQLEVLHLISEGYSNREAAHVLNVSENTVKTHMKLMFRLLNVNTWAACVSRAQSLGLIS
ncbi:MAG: response regulator transcription factor [Hyphomicrobiales bacterium]|nr:response regulator transcription factor [Hyphomicrobiales bacterium]MCP4999688.1 response regulator transcription factor [Hyphomicrobiales bacterium]